MAESSLNPGVGGSAGPATLRFDRFTLDVARAELRRDGRPVPLRPKAFDLLAALAAHPGQVLSKEQLMAAVWPGVVVTDDSLTQCVHELRSALGDAGPVLLRTVPRRGYRFDAAPSVGSADVPAEVPAPPAAPVAAVVPAPPARSGWTWGLGAAALLLAAAAVWWALASRAGGWQTPADLARAPLPREVPTLSIIVLPLALEGEAKEAEWLADALHGDLVIAVAQLQDSLVIARDTASTYKGKAVDPRQVAREMGVRHVVRGSLRQEGSRIRLSLALIDGDSGVQRWAEAFDLERAELARAVGDFAVAIDRTLVAELYRSTAQRLVTLSPSEVTADDLAMQGYALWYRGVTRENVLAARALFDRALAMNPDSARAWGGIHFTTTAVLSNSWTDDRPAAVRRAEEAAANLDRLDRDGNYAYSAKTFLLFMKRDFPAMLRTTTEWSGRYRLPLAFGAHGAALVMNGRFDDAVQVLERTLRLGPRDPFRAEWQYRLALAHFGAGRYQLASDWSHTAAGTTPALRWPPIHAAALLRLDQRAAAQQAFDDHMRRHPGFAADQVKIRMPSDEPAFAEARSRLVASLRELGLR